MLNNYLICSADSNVVKLWHLEAGDNIVTLGSHDIPESLLYADDNLLITMGNDGLVWTRKYENESLILACEFKTAFLSHIYLIARYGDLIALVKNDIFIFNIFTGELYGQLSNKIITSAIIFINRST
jgi:WD40 repeat protein